MMNRAPLHYLFASVVFAIGFAVLLTIAIGPSAEMFTLWLPATKANSALCFILSAVALATMPIPTRERGWQSARATRAAALLVLAFATATLVQYVARVDLGIDEWLLPALPTSPPDSHPGRMAPGTAVLFLLFGTALFMLANPKFVILGQILAWTGLLLDMFPLAGYLYGASPLYTVFGYARIPLPSVLAFSALGVGILATTANRGIVQILVSPGVGGQLARWLIPLAVLLPFLFGYARLLGQRAGWYQTEVGLAIFALAIVIAFTGLIFWGARWLNIAEQERRSAEEAVRKSERRYRALALATRQNVWSIRESEFLENPDIWWQKVTGQGEAAGNDWREAIHPEDRSQVNDAWSDSKRDRIPFNLAFRIRAESGAYRHLSVRAIALRDDRGEFEEWVGTNTDVTQEMELESIRRESEIRLRQLADSMPQIVWSARSDGVIDYYNRRWFDFTKTTDPPSDLTEWSKVLHPEDVDSFVRGWRESTATGGRFQAEFRLRNGASGGYRWHLGRALPIEDQAGTIVRWYGTCTDIHKQKKTERALRSIRGRLESLVHARTQDLMARNQELQNEIEDRLRLEQLHRALSVRLSAVLRAATHASIIATDVQGTITVFNSGAEQLLGYAADEMIQKQTPVLFHLAHEIHEQEVRLSREFGRPIRGFEAFVTKASIVGHETREWTYARKDGIHVPVELTVTAQRDEQGNIVGYLGVAIDLSERKQAEAALQQAKEAAESANRAKSEFLANMSHEIRTPMNGVLGMTEHLLATPLSNEQREQLSAVRDSGLALLAIINNILDFSKIEADRLELDPVPFLLRDGIFDVIKTLVAHGNEKGLSVDCFVMHDLPEHLRGDFSRIRQVLINLVGNAIKFTERGGVTILLRAEERTESRVQLHVEVSDTGIGIPASKLADIFRPFEQVDGSMSRRYGGTGLGLSISARLVELLGGRLWVESTVGTGSRFHFVIPLEVLGDREDRLEEDLVSRLKGCGVLVLDANDLSRDILSRTLESWGMVPMLARGLPEFRQLMARESSSPCPFRIAVVDGGVPDEEVRRFLHEVTRDIPVILLATPSQMTGPDNIAHGCLRLLKPVTPSDLFAVIGKALGGEPADARPNLAPQFVSESPLKILLVEDYVINQKVAAGMLRKHGHAVVIVNNGQEALDAIDAESFDLVLMDVQMPVMDGLEATRRIRQSELRTGEHLPIIALTAHAMKGDPERFLDAGMDECVTKPIDVNELLQAITRFASRRETDAARDGNGSGTDALDLPMLKQRFDGYGFLLRDVLDVFPAECARILEDLSRDAEKRDRVALARSAHALRGCLLNVCAAPAATMATELEEHCAADDDWNALQQAKERLSLESQRAIDAATSIREALREQP